MAETHIVMSITELLAWAYDETKLADMLEDKETGFGAIAGDDLASTVAKHRARSRWLDEQVANKLDEIDRKKGEGK
ncbi:MAG TPA: hypothetical protein VF867_17835 [Arthrobacter sp.]